MEEGQAKINPLGRPIQMLSSNLQVTGEAKFIDDVTPRIDELFAAPVLSTRSKARIINVDSSVALQLEGVFEVLSADNMDGM